MQPQHYRDLIQRAIEEPGHRILDLLVAQLADAQRAREILRAKGYGETGMSASVTAAQVPHATIFSGEAL